MMDRSSAVSWLRRLLLPLALCSAACTARGAERAEPAQVLPDVVATDLDGEFFPLFAGGDAKAITLIFVLPDCPISNGYAPELERVYQEYQPRGVRFHLVYPDGDVSAADARAHRAAYDLSIPALLDHELSLAGHAEATITPEVAILAPTGQLLYRGRIDDLYVDFGKRRAHATELDLRNALNSVLRGEAPDPARTRAIGCFIPPALESLAP